jgi:ureidoglycolate lyase
LKYCPDARCIRPYGDVIETEGQDFFHINDGKVQRFHDLAMVETLQQEIVRSSALIVQPAALPIIVTELERHPLGTQAFVPMRGRPLSWWSRQAAMSRT